MTICRIDEKPNSVALRLTENFQTVGRGSFIIRLRLRLVASEASHISHEVFGEIRAGGSSLARPRADFLVSLRTSSTQLFSVRGFRSVSL